MSVSLRDARERVAELLQRTVKAHLHRAAIDAENGADLFVGQPLIPHHDDQLAAVVDTYRFRDIAARWELLQGHLITTDALQTGDTSDLDTAIAHYSTGFQILSDESVGSHGSAAIAREFERFRELFDRLPREIQRNWYTRLSDDWNAEDPPEQSTSLLARLEELY